MRRGSIHSASETDRTLQDDRIFDFVHSEQEEGWAPSGVAIATHTNFFSSQREQEGMISPNDSINATVRARRTVEDAERCGGIMSQQEGHQIEDGNATPLINDLEMRDIFEDEDGEEGDGVTDLILAVVGLLERDISRLVMEAREMLEPVEL